MPLTTPNLLAWKAPRAFIFYAAEAVARLRGQNLLIRLWKTRLACRNPKEKTGLDEWDPKPTQEVFEQEMTN